MEFAMFHVIYNYESYEYSCPQQIFWRLNLRPMVCGPSLAGIVGSNLAEGMHVCLLCVLCVVCYRTLRRTDH